MARTRQGALLLLATLAAARAGAQTVVIPPSLDPGAVQQRQIDEERRRREAEQDRKPTEPVDRGALAKPAAPPADNKVKFRVREIVFSPSLILPRAELDRAAAEFVGQEVTLADLQRLTAKVNDAYHARKVVTAEAIIPPQDVSQGVIEVRLVEGRVGRTRIQGNVSTRTRFIERRLHQKPGELVDLDRLESAMTRFNRTTDAQVRAALEPGQARGTTDFQVDVAEPKRQELRLAVDNYGSPATGSSRATLAYLNRSLFGDRDALALSDCQASGQTSLASSYGFPINAWGGRVDLSGNLDKTSIKYGPLTSLRITGESKGWTAGLRQPTWLTQRWQLDLLASLQERNSTNWIDTQLLATTRTRGRNLGLELSAFQDRDSEVLNYTRSFVKATVLEPVSLLIDRGSLRYNHQFRGTTSLASNLSWQSTRQKALPSSEQIFIGGQGSVPGYTSGALSGDTGQSLSVDLRHPLGTGSLWGQSLQTGGVTTLAYGSVAPYRPPGSILADRMHLLGLAVGVNAALGSRYTASLALGRGLTGVDPGLRGPCVQFQVGALLF